MSDNGKSWLRLRWRTLFLLGVLGVVGWSVYSYWSEYSELAARKAREMMAPAVGSQCYVILRNQELGLDKAVLSPVDVNDTKNSVTGRFVQLNDDWIVLVTAQEQQLWIPREHVLLMRADP